MSITTHLDGAIATIWIERPEKRNAMTQAMWQSLLSMLQQLSTLPTLRLLIVRGAGEHFCAGADIAELSAHIRNADWLRANHADVQAAQQALYAFRTPTIAVIAGSCVGGGLGLATACDFRLTQIDARFAITPAKLGLSYTLADTRRLLDLVGPAQARRLLLSAEAITGREAERIGLVHCAVALDAVNAELATLTERLLACSPQSQAQIKRTLLALAGGQREDDAESLQAFAQLFDGNDFAEGAAAFVERRTVRF